VSSTVSIIAVLEARRRIAPHPARPGAFGVAVARDRRRRLAQAGKPATHQRLQGRRAQRALHLAERGERPTLVTASAGNHGRALAEAAAATGMACVVLTP
jgi:hypothetical protein